MGKLKLCCVPGAQVQRVSREEVGAVSLGGGDSGDQPTVPDNPSPPSVVPDSLLPTLTHSDNKETQLRHSSQS